MLQQASTLVKMTFQLTINTAKRNLKSSQMLTTVTSAYDVSFVSCEEELKQKSKNVSRRSCWYTALDSGAWAHE